MNLGEQKFETLNLNNARTISIKTSRPLRASLLDHPSHQTTSYLDELSESSAEVSWHADEQTCGHSLERVFLILPRVQYTSIIACPLHIEGIWRKQWPGHRQPPKVDVFDGCNVPSASMTTATWCNVDAAAAVMPGPSTCSVW